MPEADVDKLRLEITAQGLPTSGRIGFEIFDRTAFGATEFQEHVNYRRALEGEIARTIATLSEVASARVHIALAKESLFGSREQPAKASVVLKLRSARPLAPATIQGITNLVSGSVEGLRPEAVVVMDSFGHPLARPPAPEDDTPLGAAETERQQRVEQHLASTIVGLVEPIVGPNRVRANVAVRLSSASEERTEEKWDPAAPVIRSKQETSDITPTAGALGGVAGARGNLPPATPASPAGTPTPRGNACHADSRKHGLTHVQHHELGDQPDDRSHDPPARRCRPHVRRRRRRRRRGGGHGQGRQADAEIEAAIGRRASEAAEHRRVGRGNRHDTRRSAHGREHRVRTARRRGNSCADVHRALRRRAGQRRAHADGACRCRLAHLLRAAAHDRADRCRAGGALPRRCPQVPRQLARLPRRPDSCRPPQRLRFERSPRWRARSKPNSTRPLSRSRSTR